MNRSRASELQFWNISAVAAFLAVVAVLAFGPTTVDAQEGERPGDSASEDLPPPLADHLVESEDGPESEPAPILDPADPDAEFTNPDQVAPHLPLEFLMPAIDGSSEKLSDVLPLLDRQGLLAVADQLNTVPAGLDAVVEDGLRIDQSGVVLYEDAPPSTTAAAVASQPGPFPNSQTFLLNSRPGASKVIYLDFTGHTVSGTGWNAISGSATINVAPWYGTGVSQAEHNLIQDVWARVAEDYAPYDVNVTTQDPGFSAINRTNAADTNYGTRVLITPGAWSVYNVCSSACGGVAYVGTFDQYTGVGHAYYQPAWVHGGSLSQDAKNIAEASSHEAGHNLGLSHDGQGGTVYYAGHNLWAPIMGNSYNRPVTQWSLGEYAGANQTQDDLAVIQSNGLNFRPDDHTDSLVTSAANLTVSTTTSATDGDKSGVISHGTDQDTFEYVGDCAGGSTVAFSVNNNTVSPNLDVQLQLYNSAGTLLSTNNPIAAYVSRDVASGLDASASRFIQDGQRIYAHVDGVGVGTASTGYTDYSSLGNYTIYADEQNPANDNFPGATLSGPVAPHTTSVTTTGTNCGATKTATEPGAVGGTVWYNWTAPTTGKVFVSTCDAATNFDTYVQVYTGDSEGTLTNIANNQDGLAAWCNDTAHSRIVSMDVTAGTNYKVRVRGWTGEKGDFRLTIKYHWCTVGTLTWTPTIIGTPLAETINGTAGTDTILAYGGNDVVNGLGGNDRICGGHGDDELYGNAGLDYISGDIGDDSIFGGDGNDRLRGGAGDDFIDGVNGDDLMWGDNGDDIMYGWAGNDRMWGGNGIDAMEGDDGNDRLFGNSAGDTMRGGAGDDLLAGGDGNDVLEGDSGSDSLLGQNGNDDLGGGADDDTLWGNLGNDRLRGDDGDDILRGASGVDNMNGGTGADLMAGGSDNDIMVGDDGPDQMFGNSGDDNMSGGTGNDTLGGQDGADFMNGGANTDNCYGGAGSPDTAVNCENVNGLPGPVPAWAAEDPTGTN